MTTPTISGPSIRLSLRSVLLAVGFTVIVLGALVDIAEFVESRRVETGTRAESVAATDTILESQVRSAPLEFIESPSGRAIPVPATYAVQPGDFLYDIAISNGTTTEELIDLNSIVDPTRIEVGQLLALPIATSPR